MKGKKIAVVDIMNSLEGIILDLKKTRIHQSSVYFLKNRIHKFFSSHVRKGQSNAYIIHFSQLYSSTDG